MRSAWGQPSYNPPSRFLEEIPDQHVEWKRTGATSARPSSGPVSGVAASLSSSLSRSSVAGASGFATRRGGATEKPVISLAVGDRVTHDQFGLGTVVGVKGTGTNAEATIDFGDAKPKRLLLRYAPVEKL
jgi:DNA helicase-2/ATP-dependent DNA helicase PcrA